MRPFAAARPSQAQGASSVISLSCLPSAAARNACLSSSRWVVILKTIVLRYTKYTAHRRGFRPLSKSDVEELASMSYHDERLRAKNLHAVLHAPAAQGMMADTCALPCDAFQDGREDEGLPRPARARPGDVCTEQGRAHAAFHARSGGAGRPRARHRQNLGQQRPVVPAGGLQPPCGFQEGKIRQVACRRRPMPAKERSCSTVFSKSFSSSASSPAR